MSRSATIRRFFGNGDHDFALRIAECEQLQETFDCGLRELRERCGDVRVKEVKEVLRLGLIGAGEFKEPAARLVEREVVEGELVGAALLAMEVVNAAMAGVADEPVGERQGGETNAPHSNAESSDTATITPLGEP